MFCLADPEAKGEIDQEVADLDERDHCSEIKQRHSDERTREKDQER